MAKLATDTVYFRADHPDGYIFSAGNAAPDPAEGWVADEDNVAPEPMKDREATTLDAYEALLREERAAFAFAIVTLKNLFDQAVKNAADAQAELADVKAAADLFAVKS